MGSLSLITYVLYQYIHSIHQRHCLQSSVWTLHQRVTGHISTHMDRVLETSSNKIEEEDITIDYVDFEVFLEVVITYDGDNISE